MALILVLGGFIFYNTNVLNAYRTPDQAGSPQAEYEKRYERYEDAPQPIIDERGAARRDLSREAGRRPARHLPPGQPDRRGDRLGARVHRSGGRGALDVLRPRRRGRAHGRRGRIPDLRPRAGRSSRATRCSSRSTWRIRPRGFPNSGIQTDVVSNGTYFNRSWLPIIGYQPAFELSDDEAAAALRPPAAAAPACARRRRGEAIPLARPGRGPRPRRRGHRHGRRPDRGHARRAAPELDGERATLLPLRDRGADRRSAAPCSPPGTRCSRTAGRTSRCRSSTTRRTRYVLDRMVRSMKASLEYYTGQFGPYPDSQLRIVEVPRYGGLRPRAPAHDRLHGGQLPQPRRRGRGRPAVLRDRARGRAPVVGRAGEGRRGARRDAVPLGVARQLQRDDGDGEDATARRRPAGSTTSRWSGISRGRAVPVARGPAARGGGPAVHRLPQGRDRHVHAARADRRGARSTRRCAATSRSTATPDRRTRRRSISTPSCAPSRPTRCRSC